MILIFWNTGFGPVVFSVLFAFSDRTPVSFKEEDHEIEKYSKKRLYELLCKGVLIKKGNAWVSLGNNRRMNEMISARKFVFKKGGLRNWRSTPESRFPKVAEMFTISNLKIKINTRTQFLSPGINYGVHLVFKFCGPRKSLSKSAYVNLTYKTGKETLHTYFATWRDKEWMMIELCRFLNHKKDTNFEVQLESFSQYYCERNGVYIEGIEFRAIHDVNNEDSVKIEEVQQILESNTDIVQVQQLATDIYSEEISRRSANDDEAEKALSLNDVNEKKHLMLSAKDVLYDSSKVKCVKLFHLKPSEDPRFQEVIELLPRQVFSLKCKIQSQMLLPDADYMCYLVFKLSEKCHGLHCPVKVKDVLHWKNKEMGILYFRTPSPWNIHDNHWVPKKREDGWMEVEDNQKFSFKVGGTVSFPPLKAAKRVVLVRHGQSTWNAEGRIQGSSDFSILTNKGEAQAETSRQMLIDDSFDICFSRLVLVVAHNAINEALLLQKWDSHKEEILTDSDLRVIDLYSFQGLLKHEDIAKFGEACGMWQKDAPNFNIDGHCY
ncbi:serine/threonine-protein kinase, active site protein [Artemisia annua]|uniref:Serine/threonine-protein kinase, active site protein n=1 Tax=Artemisia annua TaxID=35608 RepID=A0A2U1LJ84_ARTAN|nr:serine/threonine-protein kinase, active site protein [Artemisia annua]